MIPNGWGRCKRSKSPTPWKINGWNLQPSPMKRKENDLNQTSIFGHGTQPLIFQGCSCIHSKTAWLPLVSICSSSRSPEFKIGNRDYLENLKVRKRGPFRIPDGMGIRWDVDGWKKSWWVVCLSWWRFVREMWCFLVSFTSKSHHIFALGVKIARNVHRVLFWPDHFLTLDHVFSLKFCKCWWQDFSFVFLSVASIAACTKKGSKIVWVFVVLFELNAHCMSSEGRKHDIDHLWWYRMMHSHMMIYIPCVSVNFSVAPLWTIFP